MDRRNTEGNKRATLCEQWCCNLSPFFVSWGCPAFRRCSTEGGTQQPLGGLVEGPCYAADRTPRSGNILKIYRDPLSWAANGLYVMPPPSGRLNSSVALIELLGPRCLLLRTM